jgi:hypothetical protein
VPWLRRLFAGSHRGGLCSIPGQSMWDLWWTKWHWDRFFPEYFGFPLSISFHRCSIARKKIIIFITGLHNKPQGCGASVALLRGPSPQKKISILITYLNASLKISALSMTSVLDIVHCLAFVVPQHLKKWVCFRFLAEGRGWGRRMLICWAS